MRLARAQTRMPLILSPEVYSAWLHIDLQGIVGQALLMDAQMDSLLQVHRISREVNNGRYEGTDMTKPLINSL
jgi:putative SOS response-associated peptidase YedK